MADAGGGGAAGGGAAAAAVVAALSKRRPNPGLWAGLKYLALRQWQTAVVTGVLVTPVVCIALVLYLYRSPLSQRYLKVKAERYLLFAYIAWWLLLDRATPSRGGRPQRWLRTLPFVWPTFRDYFPARLIKESVLDPNEKHVIAIHPHGIWSVGSAANVISENGAFDDVQYRLATISMNFRIPIWREVMLSMGLIDCSRDSLSAVLEQGKSVAVVVGGAAEALDARPGSYDLTLARRFGFVRLAMEHGAKLVPVLTLNENEVYRQLLPNPPGSLLRRAQDWALSKMGFSMPLVHGVGFLPLRRPILTIVGRALDVPHVPNPTLEQLLEVHDMYVEELQSIFHHYIDAARDALRSYRHAHSAHDSAAPELKLVDSIRQRDVAKYKRLHDRAEALAAIKLKRQQKRDAEAAAKRKARAKAKRTGQPKAPAAPGAPDADADADADGDDTGDDEADAVAAAEADAAAAAGGGAGGSAADPLAESDYANSAGTTSARTGAPDPPRPRKSPAAPKPKAKL